MIYVGFCEGCKRVTDFNPIVGSKHDIQCCICGEIHTESEGLHLDEPIEKEAKDTTGGAKFDQGKVRPSLILHGFPRAIEAVAEVGMYGLTLHEEGSWKDVPNGLQRYREALQRHLLKHATEDRDKGSGLLHEAHQCWNNLAVLELRLIEMEKATKPEGSQTP